MPSPLVGHPPWRRLLFLLIAIPVLIATFELAFMWPAARVEAREVPIGIVGPASLVAQVIDKIDAAQPGAFDVHRYADAAVAEDAIRQRRVYGAFVLRPDRVELLEATAAGPVVAQALAGVGTNVAAQEAQRTASPWPLTTTDVVALSADDPRGLVFSSALLPLTLCGILVAAVITLLVPFRPAWRQISALTLVSAAAGAGAYLVIETFLGALPHNGLADWAALALTILAISAPAAGLVALIGVPGLGVAGAMMVFVGNPFAGATSAPQLLPTAVDHIGQWLPPGAGANLLRSTAYFGGNGATGHLAVLIAWIVVGFAAIVVGHHGSARLAARRRRSDHPRHLLTAGAASPDAAALTRRHQVATSQAG